MELGLLRDADVLANQPARVRGDRERAGGGDGERQEHVSGIAVRLHRPVDELLRLRPVDRARLNALRQVERQFGGNARVTRVRPVGVPTRCQNQMQAEPERPAGRHGIGVRDQGGGRARRPHRRRLQGKRRRCGQQREERRDQQCPHMILRPRHARPARSARRRGRCRAARNAGRGLQCCFGRSTRRRQDHACPTGPARSALARGRPHPDA